MKKIHTISTILVASALAMVAASCASNNVAQAPQQTERPKKEKVVHVERYPIDWDGSEMGNDKPEWPGSYKEEGIEASDLPKKIKSAANGKMTILVEDENSDKKLAREAARNAYAFQIAQQLNTIALTTYNTVIDNNEKTQATLQATASKAQFTGWERIAETWIQLRIVDHDKGDKITDTYRYYCVYAIDKDSFEAQANKYLSDILGEVVESKNRQKVNEMTDNLVKEISDKGYLSKDVQPEELPDEE